MIVRALYLYMLTVVICLSESSIASSVKSLAELLKYIESNSSSGGEFLLEIGDRNVVRLKTINKSKCKKNECKQDKKKIPVVPKKLKDNEKKKLKGRMVSIDFTNDEFLKHLNRVDLSKRRYWGPYIKAIAVGKSAKQWKPKEMHSSIRKNLEEAFNHFKMVRVKHDGSCWATAMSEMILLGAYIKGEEQDKVFKGLYDLDNMLRTEYGPSYDAGFPRAAFLKSLKLIEKWFSLGDVGYQKYLRFRNSAVGFELLNRGFRYLFAFFGQKTSAIISEDLMDVLHPQGYFDKIDGLIPYLGLNELSFHLDVLKRIDMSSTYTENRLRRVLLDSSENEILEKLFREEEKLYGFYGHSTSKKHIDIFVRNDLYKRLYAKQLNDQEVDEL